MQKIRDEIPQKPWYRQFWPWFLLSIPIASIILSSIMITVAINGRDTVVVDNYYKEGVLINEALGKDQFAREIGLGAEIQFHENQEVQVRLESAQPVAPDYLTLKLLHPTLSGQDQDIRLEKQGHQQYVGKLTGNLSGRWYFDLVDDQDLWRLKGEVRLPHPESVLLGSLIPH